MSASPRTVDRVESIRVDRLIDLPRAIVWEALVDPVLVTGWLHPSERLATGTTPLAFEEPETSAAPAVLHVISPVFGELRVELDPVPGGTRGEASRVRLEVAGEWGSRANRERLWELRLDQLESLLRGHPVDWSAWAAEHGREAAAADCEEARSRG